MKTGDRGESFRARLGAAVVLATAFLVLKAVPASGSASVPLYWDPVTVDDQGNPLNGNLTGYRVYYATYSLAGMTTGQATLAGAVIKQNTGNVLTTTVPNLLDATTYYFRLTAFNATNESDWSVQNPGPAVLELSTCTPPAPQPPAAPVLNALGVISSSRIDASWSAVPGATGYRLERSSDLGVTYSTVANVGNVTSYIDNNPPLSPLTPYYYRLFAKNAVGDSPVSNVQNATTPALPPPPAAPTNGSAAANSTSQITVGWSDNATNEDGFDVVYALAANFSGASTTSVISLTPGNTGAMSQAIPNLTAGTTYYFHVRAVSAGGPSGFTATVSIMTFPAAPATPTFTGISSNTVTLTWGNVAGENGFRIMRSLTSGSGYVQVGQVGQNVLTFQDTNLQPNTYYYYQVHAFNGSGSTPSAQATVKTQGVAGITGFGTPPGLKQAYCYPNPARGADPVIRAIMGDVDQVEVTIFDQSGRAVHSGRATYPIQVNGETAYEYTWTGEKSPGVYYAVIHGKSGDKTIRARAKFAVVR